jgi:hypothetical protein
MPSRFLWIVCTRCLGEADARTALDRLLYKANTGSQRGPRILQIADGNTR